MARFLVVANVNADRIWTLAEKLRPGARHLRTALATQVGGAGWYAANALRAAGHEVTLACALGEDEIGRALFQRLRDLGVDTGAIRRTPQTHSYDILVDPDGERTLVFGNAVRPLPVLPDRSDFDGAYVNCWAPISAMPCVRDGAPVVVQLPLRDRTGRYPGTHVVVSRSDTDEAPRVVWARAQETAGSRVEGLILTDGPGPLLVVTPKSETTVPPGPAAPPGQMTVGAGDTFAGHLVAQLSVGVPTEAAAAEAAQAASLWLAQRTEPPPIEG
jgi:sugar/nucleoside kinase (ribokinase family)